MKVLIAISDRLFADAITRFTVAHQWSDDDEFKLITVIAPKSHQPGSTEDYKATFFAEEKAQQEKLLSQVKSVLSKALPNASVQTEVRVGSPGKEILDSAIEWPASMIVLGSHGKNKFERAFLGSASFYVASHAPCSFCIVRMLDSDILDFQLDETDIPDEMKTFAST